MKKFYKSPLIIMAIGVIVIGASTAGATRAAFVAQSEANRVNFSTAIFSVDMTGDIADGMLTFPEIEKDEVLKIGKKYDSHVSVVNNSNPETGYSEYVRVVVTKSWMNPDPENPDKMIKNQDLDPRLIKLDVGEDWIEMKDPSSSLEQTIYYRKAPLPCGEPAEFLKAITIDDTVTTVVKTEEVDSTITNTYVYNGETFNISIRADAVQTHNGEDAIYAAWGVKAKCSAVDDGNILSIDYIK